MKTKPIIDSVEIGLREYFAAAALQGVIASKWEDVPYYEENDACLAVRYADALLKALREKKEK